MTKFLLLAAIAALSIVNARSACAQAAIGEPGAYAFYHPDGDVLRPGSSVYRPQAEPYRTGYPGAMASATIGRSARGHRRRQQ